MTAFLTILLFIEAIAIIVIYLGMRDGIYQYPFLAGCIFLIFALPQFVGLLGESRLPQGGLPGAVLMSITGLAALTVGYRGGVRHGPMMLWDISLNGLSRGAVVLSSIGILFWLMIWRLPYELTSIPQWKGLPVAYLFFAGVTSIAFAMFLCIYLRRRGYIPALMMIVTMPFAYNQIVVWARRNVAAETILTLVCMLWFVRRVAIPRLIMIIAICAGTLFSYAISEYRAKAMAGGGVAGPSDIWNWATERMADTFRGEGYELRNAVYAIAAVGQSQAYDFGAFNWNAMVFNFVPSQILGEDTKNAFMIGGTDKGLQNIADDILGYVPNTGSTFTGMADAYGSFWYFGFIKFMLIGWILGRFYSSAMKGSIPAQIFYCCSIVPGLLSITHNTQWLFSRIIHDGIFILPCLFYARLRPLDSEVLGGSHGNVKS
jgi:hypothetical protein